MFYFMYLNVMYDNKYLNLNNKQMHERLKAYTFRTVIQIENNERDCMKG